MRSGSQNRRLLAYLGVLGVIVGGCNTILDNHPATFDPAAVAARDPNGLVADGGAPTDRSDTGTTYIEEASTGCPAGAHSCNGACVASDDPAYGCGDPSCRPCPSDHATPTCIGGACAIASCDPGRADCNEDAGDGCEIDLSKAASCGKCQTVCPAADPYCGPSDGGFECTNGCNADAPLLCGTECVSPQTSVNHCGGCDRKCADVANAQVSCSSGKCTFACRPSYHSCGDDCALDSDPKACGPNCAVCPTPANGTATCQGNACGIQCKPGFADCNQDGADGCEAPLGTDPLHCGGCNDECPAVANAKVSCTNGACAFACDPSFHACSGACVADTDPTACGPTCTQCPVPANALATCSANACGFVCIGGYGDCNADPADGCETSFATDPLHCGACGAACAGTCADGQCIPLAGP